MTIVFKKAVKYNARARVAIIGPGGGGKSITGLILARALAGPDGRIAAIDTEHGSLSKYADEFAFDVIELESFSPDNFLSSLTAAEEAKYDVFMCDSLSHFWIGKDGALEFVDMAAKRGSSRDGMSGWKEFRPHERMMVDRMVASPCHIIMTMRTKTDYQDVTDSNGKKKRVKVGLAPVQREGLEYEFDLIGYMDAEEHNFVVDKSRCAAIDGKVFTKPSAKDFEPFITWLAGAKRELSESQVADHNAAIEAASDEVSLKRAFAAGWKAAEKLGDIPRRDAFKAKYDVRLTKILGTDEEIPQ